MHERPYVWRGLMVLWCGELGERPYLGWGRVMLWCGAARLRGSAPGPRLLGAERQPSPDTQPRRGLRHAEFRLLLRPIRSRERLGHAIPERHSAWRQPWALTAPRPGTPLGVPKA